MSQLDDAHASYRVALQTSTQTPRVFDHRPRFSAFDAQSNPNVFEALERSLEIARIERRLIDSDPLGDRPCPAPSDPETLQRAKALLSEFTSAHGLLETPGRAAAWKPFLLALTKLLWVHFECEEQEPAAFQRRWDLQRIALYWRTLLEKGFAAWIALVRTRHPGARMHPPFGHYTEHPTLSVIDAFSPRRMNKALNAPQTIEAHLQPALHAEKAAFERIRDHLKRHQAWLNRRVHEPEANGFGRWAEGDWTRWRRGYPELVHLPLEENASDSGVAAAFVRIGTRYENLEERTC